jgi:myo-inositol-1(or 4)-monophosphatase
MPLTAVETTQYQQFAERLADAAAVAINPYFRSQLQVDDKGGRLFDPVTLADKAGERAMRELILSEFPEHGILGEEEDAVKGTSALTWVLDPIDGTRAFITGLPLWGTLIALNDGTRPVIGVMNQPFTGERFVGTPDGAWLNDAPLKTRPCASLSKARLMCTSPQILDTPERLAAFERIAAEAQLVRFGGDCYAYCMLAAGFVDVIIEASLQPYDVQALIPIIEGAGGVMTGWDGSDAQQGGAIIACGDKALHAELIKQLAPYA